MPTAASNTMQEIVAPFVGMLNEQAPENEVFEQTPLSTFQVCEDGDTSGHIVLTCAPLKCNDLRVLVVIEGHYRVGYFAHVVDAMDGRPKGDAIQLDPEWSWDQTLSEVNKEAESGE